MVQPQPSGDRLQRAGLRLAATLADRQPHIHRRALVRGEQRGRGDDLPIGNRNRMGRDMGQQVACVDLCHGQGSDQASAKRRRQLARPFPQTCMQIEDVARISLAPPRLTRQQRKFPAGRGMFGQVVTDDQPMIAQVAEPCRHAGGRERRQPAQARLVGRGGHHGDHAVGPAMAGHHRHALTDGDLDADRAAQGLGDQRIDRDRGPAGLTLANDQRALAPAMALTTRSPVTIGYPARSRAMIAGAGRSVGGRQGMTRARRRAGPQRIRHASQQRRLDRRRSATPRHRQRCH